MTIFQEVISVQGWRSTTCVLEAAGNSVKQTTLISVIFIRLTSVFLFLDKLAVKRDFCIIIQECDSSVLKRKSVFFVTSKK